MPRGKPKGSPAPKSAWKKGQSGNPLGAQRSYDLMEFRRLLREAMDPSIVATMFAEIIATGENKDRLKAAEMYLDRMFGKPTQSQQIDLKADGSLVVRRAEELTDDELAAHWDKAK